MSDPSFIEQQRHLVRAFRQAATQRAKEEAAAQAHFAQQQQAAQVAQRNAQSQVTNLNRTLEPRALREFVMRIAFQMSADDSSNLIDMPAASKLGAHRALFYDEEENRLDKFRPYGIPSEQWLDWASKQLRNRG